ncbi:MAG: hypothetical protein H6Q69_289 [Firmicutes bacterium]|nr:hypothetical protein [Bacillota bacterium]
MKKRITWLILLAVLLTLPLILGVSTPGQAMTIPSITSDNHQLIPMEPAYVGASTTGKFHYTSCRWAEKIRPDHRVYFNTREEAISAGYVPCKVCQP